MRKEEKQRQRRKEKIYLLNAEFQRIARRDKKTFRSEKYKEIYENNRMRKTRNLKKIRMPREHFLHRWAQ